MPSRPSEPGERGQRRSRRRERIRRDANFAAVVALQLRDEGATFAMTINQLIDNDEYAAVEFKSQRDGTW